MSTKAKHKERSKRSYLKNKSVFSGFKQFYPNWVKRMLFWQNTGRMY